MTRDQNILAFSSAHYAGYVMCTVPNTYREEMDRQTSHPSCGFYAASYVLNCFNPDAAWRNMELLKLAVQYPLTNRAEGCLSEVGEVFHPHDFARFIHARANGSCSAACQLFHEQTIRDTIDQGGYALVPFQVINDKQNEKHGFPRTGVQWTDLPHAHWCVIAGYVTTDNSKLLAKHWGENRLFDIDELGNSNQGCYPLQQTNNITAQRASKVQLLQNQIIAILPAQASPGRRRGCAC